MSDNPSETKDERKPITRADLREATIKGLARTKADPQSVRLSPGQRRFIVRRRARQAS